MRPFRFGLFAESAVSRDALFELARKAEDQGFSTFLIRDHFIAEPFGPQFAPLATLATVAGATKRLRIGSLVFCNDYRHPVQLAKEAATLDVLSEGRFEIGIGAGFSRSEYEQAGMRFDPARVRIERLGETIRILKGLFSGNAFDFRGNHYNISGLANFPAPVQRPHPPILIAGTSARMLGLAAAEADIVGFQTVATGTGAVVQDPALRRANTVRGKIEELRLLAGDRFDAIELNVTASVIVTDDRRGEAERFAQARGWSGLSGDDVVNMPSVFIGSVDTIVAEMQARRESFGFSYFAIQDRASAAAAPIVSRLAGR
jgi:probable F420-dependent oxidoreductase